MIWAVTVIKINNLVIILLTNIHQWSFLNKKCSNQNLLWIKIKINNHQIITLTLLSNNFNNSNNKISIHNSNKVLGSKIIQIKEDFNIKISNKINSKEDFNQIKWIWINKIKEVSMTVCKICSFDVIYKVLEIIFYMICFYLNLLFN